MSLRSTLLKLKAEGHPLLIAVLCLYGLELRTFGHPVKGAGAARKRADP